MNMNTKTALLESLKAEAAAAHVAYPQYKGYWTDFALVKVTKRVRTKMGVAFERGEVVIGKRDEKVSDPSLSPATLAELNKPSWTLYSRSNGMNTRVGEKHVRTV